MKIIALNKNTVGTLYITLEDFFGIKPSRTFQIDGKNKQIPFDYALSIFMNNDLKAGLDKGLFYLSGPQMKDFKEFAQENLGDEIEFPNPEQYVSSQVQKDGTIEPIKNEEILEVLKEGKESTVEKLLEKEADRAHIIASEHKDELTTKIVRVIEDTLQVGVGVEE